MLATPAVVDIGVPFTAPAALPQHQLESMPQSPLLWPPPRVGILTVPEKPPEGSLSHGVLETLAIAPAVIHVSPKPDISASGISYSISSATCSVFSHQRPLLLVTFTARPLLHHSIILQMDGLLHACFRVRLERDVCISPCDAAFCVSVGPGMSPASTFCGLYWPAPHLLAIVLRAVKLERGYGVFVGPADSDAWPNSADAANQRKAQLLSFLFLGPNSANWCGRFYSFAYQGKVKRKKADVCFTLAPILSRNVPARVAALPFCPARVSEMQHFPVASDDTAKRSPPLAPALDIPRPLQTPVWNFEAMVQLATTFPHSAVASLFSAAVHPLGARVGFAGDSSKRVLIANGALEPAMVIQIRERFIAEVAVGRMMGPFVRCPFPNAWNPCQARSTPLDTRKKDKYDPLSERFRVISNFSAGRESSINNLIYSPKLLSAHLQSSHLRDVLFSLGPGARFSAIDQQDAFRADHINLADAHLYCYQVLQEWFIDLRDPFGNVKSEYTYAIIVAVLKWALEGNEAIVDEGSHLLGYVDNWFLLSRASSLSHNDRWAHLKSEFMRLGAPMHEEQCSLEGTVNALGWDWDLSTNSFSCPVDKYLNCKRLSAEWATRAASNCVFTFKEIESIAGLFQWISTACPTIIASVASLQGLKHTLKINGQRARVLDDRCAVAVIALADFFSSWDRTCPLFAGFSPTAQWELLIRVDASTDFGAGGFCVPSFGCLIHAWSDAERAQALAHSVTPLRESTTFFELLGILLTLRHFAPLLRGKRVQIECDNEAAIRDLVCFFSGKPQCMSVIAAIRDLCASCAITPRFEHILASFNCVADRLSHDLFPQASEECLRELHAPLLVPHRS